MTTRKNIRRSAVVLLVAGAAAGFTVSAAGTAAAMPTDFDCTSGQVTSQLVYGGAGAGGRDAAIQFTAKQGETCTLPGTLPLDLVGAHDVVLSSDAAPDAPRVEISDGSSAYIPLHWSAIGSPQQETPLAITVTAPQETSPRGDTSDPRITLPWDFGAVNAAPESHTIRTGAVTAGTAPTV
ncbi:hypothetical protein GCM10027598_78950 [Amycolatopsis oliviviridis]|uniref:DUF4232 domain-containing protein n=1 Tax=Amycolatopsis oliviviridis TaxID=1471590 RepID=A0ABQ3L6A5_9PSEU|nr:DUF4232 domain-containing protein [Amycolatopsis oliviviridis]GHH05217.1 hypothetical protein GCM10017790_08880 [Amycolatopsis oliviviridis]